MKLKYEAQKNNRIKRSKFMHVVAKDINIWFYSRVAFPDKPKIRAELWDSIEEIESYRNIGCDCSNACKTVHTVKAFRKALKRWSKYLPSGTEFVLYSSIPNNRVFGRTK